MGVCYIGARAHHRLARSSLVFRTFLRGTRRRAAVRVGCEGQDGRHALRAEAHIHRVPEQNERRWNAQERRHQENCSGNETDDENTTDYYPRCCLD